jgi:small subunit ribosomal protein S20e
MTSRKVAALERTCKELKVRGPVRMPTKKLNLMVRKSPCGEGTNTFDRWQMRIHKRILDLHAPADLVKQLTNITIEPGVDIDVNIIDEN